MEQETILKALGFTAYETKTYLALAYVGEATAKTIAEKSGLPKNKTYEVLQTLEKKGFILSVPVSPRKYRLEPIERLQEGILQKKEEVAALEQQYKKLAATVTRQQHEETAEIFSIIKTKTAIERKLAEHDREARKEILSCHTFSRELPTMTHGIEQAIKRGVRVKVLVPVTSQHKKMLHDWLTIGAEIRLLKQYPGALRFTVFDGKAVRITIGTPEVKDRDDFRTLWVESKSFAAFMREHFLMMWKGAKKIVYQTSTSST